MNGDVYVVRTEARYPAAPFDGEDSVSGALRSLFLMWGRNPRNPFEGWVKPGDRVVIKPNWVHHENRLEPNLDALVSHSSLVKHLLDLLALALDGRGSVVIGDAPLQSCAFDQLMKRTGIGDVVARAQATYPRLEILIEDWRLTVLPERYGGPVRRGSSKGVGEERYRLVDLGASSFLEEIADYADLFRVTCYPAAPMTRHHQKGKHEYLVTNRVFDADFVINLPKMKTHIKAGLTGALKNLVGVNGHKEYLPHHIKGASEDGGDCYVTGHRIRRWYDAAYDRFWEAYGDLSNAQRRLGSLRLGALWRAGRMLTGDTTATGSWYGNETVWRMTLDLNHLVYFGPRAARRIITIVDGIVAGEGDGPLQPTSKHLGLLVGGENPAHTDCVLGRLMGYNLSRVPTLYHAIHHRKSRFGGTPLEDVRVRLWEKGEARTVSMDGLPDLDFVKPEHWRRASRIPRQARWSRSDMSGAEQPA